MQYYDHKKTSGLVIFIPGILTEVSSSGFLNILKTKSNFDALVYNVYSEANDSNMHKGINDLVKDLGKIIDVVKKNYKKIFFISYSSGSEILLRAKFPLETRAMALWSLLFLSSKYYRNIEAV